MEKRRFYGVDIIKVLCAVMIVCLHTDVLSSFNPQINSLFVNCICRVAVPFFFVASGFFLFCKMSLDNLNFLYIKKYLKRILKLYLLWSLVYFPFTALKMITSEKEAALKIFLSWLKNMVFSAGYGFLWYLPATIVAILIVTLLLKSGVKINGVLVIGFVLYCIGLCGQSYFGLVKQIPHTKEFENVVKTVYDFIVTTRNGVFEGVIFIALGAKISQQKNKQGLKAEKELTPKNGLKTSVIGLAVSFVLLVFEFFIVSKMEWRLEYDMYMFLIPAAYFLFKTALNINIKVNDFNIKYLKLLRPYSSLIYFIHMIFIEFYCILTRVKYTNSLLMFLIGFIPTVIVATLIIALSKNEHFKFLKNFY